MSAALTKGGTEYSITSDGTYIYAFDRSVGTMYKLSTNGSIISQKDTSVTFNSLVPLMYDGTYLYVSNLSKSWMFDMDMNLIKTFPVGISSSIVYMGGVYAADKFYLFHHGGTLYAHTFQDHYFARTLLASPITKTNQNTMKVIYEFIRS